MLKTFGNKVICIDGTHVIGYDFYLFSILVLDEYHQEYPCALMITNRKDTKNLELLYAAVQKKVGRCVNPQVFMSDMAAEIYNAW